MHSLLKRQIRKHLPENLKDSEEVTAFLEAINNSYEDYDEKADMVQRAMNISSAELFQANKVLRLESESQRKTLTILEKAIRILNDTKITKNEETSTKDSLGIDALELAAKIEKQAKDIIKMTAEKNALLKNLERQNASLNDYAHMVSHDLKSPIRNINALMCWILEDEKEKFSSASIINCNLVSQNLQKMDALIDGILRHAVIDSLEEEQIQLNLNNLIEEIKKTIFIPENIQVRIYGKLPTFLTEKYKVEQLFKNLITNAVTATEHVDQGLIIIQHIDDTNFWKFSVTDNGKGIAKKHQESIFNMFKKLENDSKASGIGLALVKKVVNIYDGDIWLESEENKGTTIYFTLKK
ncbi:HAMP domain-containing histidine kinase [Cellulophaga sp. E16_2]|uniref:sensor histidine kinase n=1 Tax=Cellulophaga sp. E16_2 TaxID=2789297 RepID=UPI001A91629E|nr:HAMP domain-containing sensor histidine kinase [Cellulophaga sp. E16_2]MBO0592737.1 HAMP domain-containing histidine kinase [Cellulophaga sp. E16_2]